MLVPRVWKASTAANATSAAATAYSDSSRPVSSFMNLLNMFSSLPSLAFVIALHAPSRQRVVLPGCWISALLDLAREVVDLVADVAAQSLEGQHRCQRDERCGD